MTIDLEIKFKVNGDLVAISNKVTAEELALGLAVVLEYKWWNFLTAWKEDRYCVIRAGEFNLGLVIITENLDIEEIRIFEEEKYPSLKKRVLLTLIVAKEKGNFANFIHSNKRKCETLECSYRKIEEWIAS